ncbi:MAG: FkbM family methyltransferase [Patescibacteria group bacterium]
MIDPKATTTYAQYNEDLILSALFGDVDKGFYVDVGANYPTIDSVTKLFYDKGWTGINIEPIKGLHKQLEQKRPNDINLQCGAGQNSGSATLREYKSVSGHSTFDAEQKASHDKALEYEDYEVPIKTLEAIFETNKVKHIHFLKVDVEGFEYEVVAGNNWKKYRPEVICIEANHVTHDWRTILDKNDYLFFIADGLNEYYIEKKAWKRTDNFAERIIDIDYHALKQHQWQSWSKDSEDLERLHATVAEQAALIDSLQLTAQELEALSLKNRTYLSRLKRSAYGLTIDWVRHKKASK